MMIRALQQKIPFVKIYLDDILVHVPGTPQEHLHSLEHIFQCMRKVNLKLKVENVFLKLVLPYLGQIIDKN